MGLPSSRVDTAPRAAADAAGRSRKERSDALAEIDDVLDQWSSRRRDFGRLRVEAEEARQEFIPHTEGLASSVLRPSLQTVAQRLRASGGDGTVVERPRDALHGLRLTLWMALDRKITVLERRDLYPYIRLDLDVARRRFTVWEGDVGGEQGSSRPADPWMLGDITGPVVTERVVTILRIAASHKVIA